MRDIENTGTDPNIGTTTKGNITIGNTVYTVKRKYTGTKTLTQLYEDFLKRKAQNI